MLAAVVGLAGVLGCGGAPPVDENGPDYHPTRDAILAAPVLALDVPVHGSTDDPMEYIGAICTGGGTAGKRSARAYRFVPPQTATYRFDVHADFPAVLDVLLTRPGPQENRSIACVGTRTFGVRTTLRGGEAYAVVIDGEMQAQGTYELVARRDDSAAARVRAEDPGVVAALVAHAPRLDAGRVLGTFVSAAGGARARCGGLGSGTLFTLEVAAPTTLALHAVTQFPAALEVRARGGASVACARGEPGAFEVGVTTALAAGSYVVVVDTTDVAPELFDPLTEFPVRVDVPGPGVRGAFALDAALEAAP